MIKTLHVQIEEEKQAFEEQKETERQRRAEQQNMAAVRIQACFRAFVVRKEYVPVLRGWKAELKRRQELQEAMEREKIEKEERLRQRVLELKQQQERERKIQEEKKRQELADKMKRQEEYEKKKEMVRLLRQEQLKLEEQKRKEESKLNWEPRNKDQEIKLAKEEHETEKGEGDETKNLSNKMGSENRDKNVADNGMETEKVEQVKEKMGNTPETESENEENCLVIARKEEGIKPVQEQEAESAAGKPELVLEKEQKEQLQDVGEQDEKLHGMICEKLQHENGVNEVGKHESEKEEHLHVKHGETSIVNEVPGAEDHSSTTGDFQTTKNTKILSINIISVLDQENSIYNNHNNMDVRFDSGDARRAEKTNSLKNIEFPVSEIYVELADHLSGDDKAVKCVELPDSLEEKRLVWMKKCKSWSRIYRENQRKKVVEKSRPRKCSAGTMPPLSAATIIQAGPWNALEQVSHT